MKVHRIPKTEWFECTTEEVKEAINNCKLALPGLCYKKNQNTTKSRGVTRDKEEVNKEKRIAKDPDKILTVMKIYSDTTSIRRIATRFVEYYKIKQFSPSSISVIIGDTIQKLLENEIIKNKGDHTHPYLYIPKENKNMLKVTFENAKPTLKTSNILKALKNCKEGLTVKEIQNMYSIECSTGSLYDYLNENAEKVKEKDRYNRVVYRYIHPDNYKIVPPRIKNDIEITYTEGEKLKVTKALKNLNKQYNYRIPSHILVEETNLQENKLKEIIAKEFPKLIVYKNKQDKLQVCYKSDVLKSINFRKLTEEKRKQKFKEDSLLIESALKENNGCLSTKEISLKLGCNRQKIYRILQELRKESNFVKFGEFIYLKDKFEENQEDYKGLPIREQFLARRFNITRKVLLDIIQKSPHCTSQKVHEELLSYCNITNENSTIFQGLVAAFKRDLIKNNLIVCTTATGRLHIKNNEFNRNVLQSNKYKLNDSKIVDFIKSSLYGKTTKEIYDFIRGCVSLASLYNILTKFPDLKKVKIIKEGSNVAYIIRWFYINNRVVLKDNEELYDALG